MAVADGLTMWERMITKDGLVIDEDVTAWQPSPQGSPVPAAASGSSSSDTVPPTLAETVPVVAEAVPAESRVAVVRPAANFAHTSLPPLSLQSEPFCKLCHRKVDPIAKGTKIVGKSKAIEYQCGSCGAKLTIGNRVCGEWPTEEFKLLSSETQVKFYQEGGGAN